MVERSSINRAPPLCHLVLASQYEMQQLQRWFNNAEQLHNWGGDSFDYPYTAQQFIAQLCRPATQSYSLITGHAAQWVGFGQLCDRFGCHHLARLVIAPTHRGKGLARTLIYELFIKALAEQPKPFSLYVHRHNTLALQLYIALGFVITPPPEPKNPRLHFMTLEAGAANALVQGYLSDVNRRVDER
uniref:GNAT family N-acetyltransferase n=1 Tax=Rheinheimera sp. TaxID=1869214 RepID=UPI004047D95E